MPEPINSTPAGPETGLVDQTGLKTSYAMPTTDVDVDGTEANGTEANGTEANGTETNGGSDEKPLSVKGSKPQQADIRSFFSKASALKRKNSGPNEVEPQSKRTALTNGLLDQPGNGADDEVVEILCLRDSGKDEPEVNGPPANGLVVNGVNPDHLNHGDAVSNASVPQVTHPCSSSEPVDPVAACKGREIRIELHRLENTEFFTEHVRKQLEQWREWKSWEGQDYEVEAVVDYSWCKRTVSHLISTLVTAGVRLS